MTVSLSLFAGVGAQFFTDDGVPLSGGLIYSYEAGTNTPKTTYTSRAGNIAHTNPIILNSAGRVPGGEIWLTLGSYKFILATSTNVTIATYDNVFSIAGDFNLVANWSKSDLRFLGNLIHLSFITEYSPRLITGSLLSCTYNSTSNPLINISWLSLYTVFFASNNSR